MAAPKTSALGFMDRLPAIKKMLGSSNHMFAFMVILYLNSLEGLDIGSKALYTTIIAAVSIGGARIEEAFRRK